MADAVPNSSIHFNSEDLENLQENQPHSQLSLNEPPSLEEVQNEYYKKGLEELESLQLLDLSSLARWKLSSSKHDHGLAQLRNDSPDSYWQSDGSSEEVSEAPDGDAGALASPHHVTLSFSKRVSLERISLFTNYQLDESYTPLRLKIMAGSSNLDLTEVSQVTLDRPVGWLHIIFKGVRADGLLKCFVVKIVVLANHQEGKDTHLRALRCYGKKSLAAHSETLMDVTLEVFPNYSTLSESTALRSINELADEHDDFGEHDATTALVLANVADVVRFNSGFDSLELRSISSIR